MRRLVRQLAVLVGVLAFACATQTAHADGVICQADLTSGPPGTKFQISCTGFSPNTYVNAYVVEPDGRAVSGAQIVGFSSNVGNGNILTDKDGSASFAWQSQDGSAELGGSGGFSDQLGDWTWTVHQLGQADSVLVSGQTRVTLSSVSHAQVGASLTATNSDRMTYNFSGSGFWRDEYVNVWVTLPPSCSGSANAEAAGAVDPYSQGIFDGFMGPSTVKANDQGEIAFSILFTARACRGEYQTTVHAPGSDHGAIASYQVNGDAMDTSSNLQIIAVPSSVDAMIPVLTILGSKWNAHESINCWSTRPDGSSFSVGTVSADTNGNFALDIHISGTDSSVTYASEEPGLWSLTCRAPSNGDISVTTVMVRALTSDP